MDGGTDRWTDGRMDRQADRQTDDQLSDMKAIKQCTCNGCLLTSMNVQIGINLMVNNNANHVYCRRPGPGHLLN